MPLTEEMGKKFLHWKMAGAGRVCGRLAKKRQNVQKVLRGRYE